MMDFILSFQWVFIFYFLGINTAYLALNYISIFSIISYMRDHRAEYLPNVVSYQPVSSSFLLQRARHHRFVHSLATLD